MSAKKTIAIKAKLVVEAVLLLLVRHKMNLPRHVLCCRWVSKKFYAILVTFFTNYKLASAEAAGAVSIEAGIIDCFYNLLKWSSIVCMTEVNNENH